MLESRCVLFLPVKVGEWVEDTAGLIMGRTSVCGGSEGSQRHPGRGKTVGSEMGGHVSRKAGSA